MIDSYAPTSIGVRSPTVGPIRYQRGFFDLRRYNRLAPNAALNLRFLTGGWLSGDPLPLERRLSIDGPGTVPTGNFSPNVNGTDVGTCSAGPTAPGKPAQCDRVLLAQLGPSETDIHILVHRNAPSRHNRFRADGAWVFFADAGRGWLVNSPGSPVRHRPGHDLHLPLA